MTASCRVTCLDAAPAIGAALREFGGVVFATATPGPADRFAECCDCPAASSRSGPPRPGGTAPMTSRSTCGSTLRFQHRQRHISTTAGTVAGLHRSAGPGSPIAVFFPSYAYAEAVAREFGPAALQPRRGDLSAQNAWINASLEEGRALFLVLGSGFAEGSTCSAAASRTPWWSGRRFPR